MVGALAGLALGACSGDDGSNGTGPGRAWHGNPRLGSQGSVLLSPDNRLLFVANVGSNEIYVFTVNDDGLKLVDRVDSGDEMPVSVNHHGDVLHVLMRVGRARA